MFTTIYGNEMMSSKSLSWRDVLSIELYWLFRVFQMWCTKLAVWRRRVSQICFIKLRIQEKGSPQDYIIFYLLIAERFFSFQKVQSQSRIKSYLFTLFLRDWIAETSQDRSLSPTSVLSSCLARITSIIFDIVRLLERDLLWLAPISKVYRKRSQT